MELIRIFVSEDSENGLWSISKEGAANEFEKFFEQVNDIVWLHDFFSLNSDDLNSGFFGKMTIDETVVKTMNEAEEMESALYDFTHQGFSGHGARLQSIFKPLNNFEYVISLYQKSKARLKNGWLRLYAIRLDWNCFVVTGGAIKLTSDMRSDHLQYELKKLEQTKTFLQQNEIHYPEDLNTYNND